MSETKNETQVKRKIKTKDGKEYIEEKVVDNKTGKVNKHELKDSKTGDVIADGTVKKENPGQIIIDKDDVHLIHVVQLLSNIDKKLNSLADLYNIRNQLIETNFYTSEVLNKIAPEEMKKAMEQLPKHFEKYGIKLNG